MISKSFHCCSYASLLSEDYFSQLKVMYRLGFPGGPVVKTVLLVQGAWVQSLLEEDAVC